MKYFTATEIGPLISRARSVLGMTQEEFGHALGSSHRSAQRWDAGTSEPGLYHLQTLVRLLYPKDAALSTQIADVIRETPESLGIVPPAPPAAVVPARPRPPTEWIVESIVCAAADALAMQPAGVRPALRAAFERAKAMELTVDEVDAVLSPKAPPKADGAEEGRGRRKPSRGGRPRT